MEGDTREPTGRHRITYDDVGDPCGHDGSVRSTGAHPAVTVPSWWDQFASWVARAQLVKLAAVGIFGGGLWGAVMIIWTGRGWFDGLATKAEVAAVVEAQRSELEKTKLQVAKDAASIHDLRSDVDTLADVFRWQGNVLSALAAKQKIDVPPLPPFLKKKEPQ